MPKVNVLLIEDSAPDAMLLKIALDEAGLDYALTSLCDGQKALDHIRDAAAPKVAAPDIILLDVNVPKVNGLEILREIRTDFRFAGTPVFVLSSSQSPRNQTAIRNMTGTVFETKPLDLDGFLELGRTIKRFLDTVLKTRQVDASAT
jgi:CheY-like chemotaxis protein